MYLRNNFTHSSKSVVPFPGAVSLARNFETLVTRDLRWFDAITYDLAAFEPDSVRRRYWPTEYLNRLEQELDQNPIGLRAKLAEAFTVSELLRFSLLFEIWYYCSLDE